MKYVKSRISQFDDRFTRQASRYGHRAERFLIGIIFLWFGTLKLMGETSATSIIAKSVYWIEPSIAVPFLGGWEVLMGVCLMSKKLLRVAIGLFFLRLPGTLLSLIYHWDECFADSVLIPTIQGQYLLKELTLVGAALVIASTVPSLSRQRQKSLVTN